MSFSSDEDCCECGNPISYDGMCYECYLYNCCCSNCCSSECNGECKAKPLFECVSCKRLTTQIADSNDGCPACIFDLPMLNFYVGLKVQLKGTLLVQYTAERNKYLTEQLKNKSFKTKKNRRLFMLIWGIDINKL